MRALESTNPLFAPIKEIKIIGNENNFGWLATRPWLPIPQNLKNRLSLNPKFTK